MHRLISPLAIALALVLLPVAQLDARAQALPIGSPRQVAAAAGAAFAPGEVVVKFRPGVATAKRDPLAGELGLVREERLDNLAIDRYRLAAGGDVFEAARRLRQRPDVLYAEPNYTAELALVPDD